MDSESPASDPSDPAPRAGPEIRAPGSEPAARTSPRPAPSPRPRHAWPGKLLVALLALGGLGALGVAAWSMVAPPAGTVRMFGLRTGGWLLASVLPRLLMAVFGGVLLAVGWGVTTWRRWAWWASIVLVALFGTGFTAQLLAPLWHGEPASVLDFYALLYVACVPYLLRNRRHFHR